MNKKIKIIDLLQDLADEKEIVMPKYIRYWDRIGHKYEVMLVCKENIIDKLDDCKIDLNDEVEILEDNTEEIEELDKQKAKNEIWTYTDANINKSNLYCLSLYTEHHIVPKINELVKAVNSIRKDKNE